MTPRRIKVAHLTTVHNPMDTRIFQRQCKTLAAAGYEVVLIAPAERDGLIDGVRLKAVPRPVGRSNRVFRTIGQVYRAAVAEKAAVYHFHDPELLLMALLLRQQTGSKIIYDAHEDVPRTIAGKEWLPTRLRPAVAALSELVETQLAARHDAVITATTTIGRKFDPARTIVVQNFIPADELTPLEPIPYYTRQTLFAYVGWTSELRGAKEMVMAINKLDPKLNARLKIAGTISPPSLRQELELLDNTDLVDLLGWQSREEVRDLLGSARAGLVVLQPAEQYYSAQPVKLFEYMAAGIPVIASDFPYWRRMVEDAGCGLLVDPSSPEAIAEAMRWILEHPAEAESMGQRGREAMLRSYTWDSEAKKLLDLYARLTD